jgi:hypothetical protein
MPLPDESAAEMSGRGIELISRATKFSAAVKEKRIKKRTIIV